jgi:hypothetical protein
VLCEHVQVTLVVESDSSGFAWSSSYKWQSVRGPHSTCIHTCTWCISLGHPNVEESFVRRRAGTEVALGLSFCNPSPEVFAEVIAGPICVTSRAVAIRYAVSLIGSRMSYRAAIEGGVSVLGKCIREGDRKK